MTYEILDDRACTVKEAAKFLGVTEEGVLSLIHRGELAASNINTRPNAQRPQWRILASAIGKFMARTRHVVEQPKRARRRAKPLGKDYFAEV